MCAVLCCAVLPQVIIEVCVFCLRQLQSKVCVCVSSHRGGGGRERECVQVECECVQVCCVDVVLYVFE